MKLSLPPKLVEKLVWVLVILFVKFHSQLRVDALLLPKLAVLSPPNRLTLRITLMTQHKLYITMHILSQTIFTFHKNF